MSLGFGNYVKEVNTHLSYWKEWLQRFAGRYCMSFLIIKIHKNATQNSTGIKIDVQVSFEVKKNRNPSGNVQSLRLPLLSAGWEMPWSWRLGVPNQFSHCLHHFFNLIFLQIVFEIVKACLDATVAACHSQWLVAGCKSYQMRFMVTTWSHLKSEHFLDNLR